MSLLTGTVFSFGTFSNNNAFKGVEICHKHTSKSHWSGANNIKYNRNILLV